MPAPALDNVIDVYQRRFFDADDLLKRTAPLLVLLVLLIHRLLVRAHHNHVFAFLVASHSEAIARQVEIVAVQVLQANTLTIRRILHHFLDPLLVLLNILRVVPVVGVHGHAIICLPELDVVAPAYQARVQTLRRDHHVRALDRVLLRDLAEDVDEVCVVADVDRELLRLALLQRELSRLQVDLGLDD